jgi:hypothetical protein
VPEEVLDLFESVLSLLAKIQRKLHHFNLHIDFTNLGPGTCDTIKAQENRSITSGWLNVNIFLSLGVVEFFRWSVARNFTLLRLTPDFQELPSAGKRRELIIPLSKCHLIFLESYLEMRRCGVFRGTCSRQGKMTTACEHPGAFKG